MKGFAAELRDLATHAQRFVDDPAARPHFIAWLKPVFRDPEGLILALQGPNERQTARELAAAALIAAEAEGDAEAQSLFRKALRHLAPLASPQGAWLTQYPTVHQVYEATGGIDQGAIDSGTGPG
ncbi:hypothetical protein BH11ARM2_BH11ARM2_26820 [soil metagenome]